MSLTALVKKDLTLPEARRKTFQALADKYNKPASQSEPAIKTVALLVDATGSMDSVWEEVKVKLKQLINRLNKLVPGIKLLIVAYRDYNDEQILEEFGPSADVEHLQQFISQIVCSGGDDFPEAVEVVLDHLNQLRPDMAILVGDAPPHGVTDQVRSGGDYRKICSALGLPVYTVVVKQDSDTLNSFKEIARLTSGKSFSLQELDDLIDVLSVSVAKKTKQVSRLAQLIKAEQGGRLTDRQEKLLLES